MREIDIEGIIEMLDEEIEKQIKLLEDWDWDKEKLEGAFSVQKFKEQYRATKETLESLSNLKKLIMLTEIEEELC